MLCNIVCGILFLKKVVVSFLETILVEVLNPDKNKRIEHLKTKAECKTSNLVSILDWKIF